MNEGAKTGIFWGVALVMLAIAAIVAWPSSTEDKLNFAGLDLFEEFQDPLAAANMKITTFDEEQGTLDYFEVRKDPDSGLWKIMSRYAGYPADAVEQMKNAANSLVSLKILDIQTSNSEDHDDLGVIEPDLDNLKIGDDGVGRLVAFKDSEQKTLASLIIGNKVKDEAGKVYVRKPGQDPVYVVKFDDSTLTTRFQDWIEEDLLQLSSIEIAELEIKNYNASLNMQTRGLDVVRYYNAKLGMDGADWKLDELLEYDPQDKTAEPKVAIIGEDKTLNKTKLDDLKNAVDDLKIVSVVRKPEGMSANLRASEDLLSDPDAVGSLAQHGFFPVASGRTGASEESGAYDIYSANGELSVTVKDGVKYIMRFGNISGLTDSSQSTSEEGDQEIDAGVNRYLLVTTDVDLSKFPAPELKAVPQTLEDLDAILNPKPDEPQAEAEQPASEKQPDKQPAVNSETKPAEETPSDEPSKAKTTETPAEETEAKPEAVEKPEAAEEPESVEESEADGETESSGSGEATGKGEAQESAGEQQPAAAEQVAEESDKAAESAADQPDAADQEPVTDEVADAKPADAKPADTKPADTKPADAKPADAKPADAKPADAKPADAKPADAKPADAKPADAKPADAKPAESELTKEEMLERLEAEQEKITKENQRKLDERKDKLEAAKRRVRDLNDRFADWYYVIPEDTYTKLHIKRDELFEKPADATPTPGLPSGGPQLNIPGFPGN